MPEKPTDSRHDRKRAPWRSWFVIALVVVLAGSVAARIWLSGSGSTGSGAARSGDALHPDGLVPGERGSSDEAQGTTRETASEVLPVVTEASFFGILGFALGYASRKALKVGLILLAVLFLAVQGLSYLNVISVDWSRAIDLVNRFVLNLNEGETIGEVVKNHIPSAGTLTTGYLLGFRKG